jgi:hypothetical protein
MRSCVGQATLRALNVATTSGQLVATPPHAALTPHARRLRGGAGGRRGFCGRVLGAYGDKQVGEVGARRQARSQEARVESGSMRGGMPEDIRDAVAAVHRADAKAVLYIAGDRAPTPPIAPVLSGFQHMWAATPAFPTPTQHSHPACPAATHPHSVIHWVHTVAAVHRGPGFGFARLPPSLRSAAQQRWRPVPERASRRQQCQCSAAQLYRTQTHLQHRIAEKPLR